MTRWLITGAGGQVGQHLLARLGVGADNVVGRTRAELDITDPAAVRAVLAAVRPDVVVNAAAYTAVDAAEADEQSAYAVNALGPRVLAEALDESTARLLHVSTDYVFDGTATTPYEPADPTGPRTAYGRTKLAGEQAVRATLPDRGHVVRAAWVHGGPGANFVSTMIRLAGERDTLDVVADQIGSPTWAGDLAAALIELGHSEAPAAVRHYVNAGQASWFELAQAVFAAIGADPQRVQPTDTASFPRPAPRPPWSVLSTRSWTDAGLTAPRPWQDAVEDAVDDIASRTR